MNENFISQSANSDGQFAMESSNSSLQQSKSSKSSAKKTTLLLSALAISQFLILSILISLVVVGLNQDTRNKASESLMIGETQDYIVKFKSEKQASTEIRELKTEFQVENSRLRTNGIAQIPSIKEVPADPNIALLKVPENESELVLENLAQRENIEYIEPVVKRVLFAPPNDSYYSMGDGGIQGPLWHLDLMRIHQAWEVTGGQGASSIKVAVIDSGVLGSAISSEKNYISKFVGSNLSPLPEFSATKFSDPAEVACDSQRRPAIVEGWSINSAHGSHVTASIAQMTNNNSHSAGVASNVVIIPINVFTPSCGGPTSLSTALAIDYAVAKGAKVINMSLGIPACQSAGEYWPDCNLTPFDQLYSQYEREAVKRAVEAGVTIVVAAGNDGTISRSGRHDSSTLSSPGNFPEVITVGAVRADQRRAAYSSFKPFSSNSASPPIVDRGLDISAAGGQVYPDEIFYGDKNAFPLLDQNNDGVPDGIIQATIKNKTKEQTEIKIDESYVDRNGKRWYCVKPITNEIYTTECGSYQGTSMAAPLVSGVVALMLSVNSNLRPEEIKNILKETAFNNFADYQLDPSRYGAGIVNAEEAVKVAKARANPTSPTPEPTPSPSPDPTPSPTPSPSPSPSPDPTPTPTPEPTPSPTPQPTPSLSPQPTPSPSPTPTPEPTPSPSPSPTPTPTSTPQQPNLPGDINLDGIVNSIDYSILLDNYLRTDFKTEADINKDGVVNSIDYSILLDNYLRSGS